MRATTVTIFDLGPTVLGILCIGCTDPEGDKDMPNIIPTVGSIHLAVVKGALLGLGMSHDFNTLSHNSNGM